MSDTVTSTLLVAMAATCHDKARADLDAAHAAARTALAGLVAAGKRYSATVAALREQLALADLEWDLGASLPPADLIEAAVASIKHP